MALRFRSIHRQTLNHSTLQVQSVLNGALGLSSSLLPLQSRVTSVSPTTRTARRSFATIAANTDRVRRRKRPNFGKLKFEGTGPPKILFEQKGLDEPFSYGGEDGTSADEYLNKTSLSPWVPIPDPIARKLFDMSAPTPEDVLSFRYKNVSQYFCLLVANKFVSVLFAIALTVVLLLLFPPTITCSDSRRIGMWRRSREFLRH